MQQNDNLDMHLIKSSVHFKATCIIIHFYSAEFAAPGFISSVPELFQSLDPSHEKFKS